MRGILSRYLSAFEHEIQIYTFIHSFMQCQVLDDSYAVFFILVSYRPTYCPLAYQSPRCGVNCEKNGLIDYAAVDQVTCQIQVSDVIRPTRSSVTSLVNHTTVAADISTTHTCAAKKTLDLFTHESD